MALALQTLPEQFDDDGLAALAARSPGWRLEVDERGALLVSPTFSDGGPRDVEAALQLRRFAESVGGKVFGSSAGFRLPDGSVRAPDASWISEERLACAKPGTLTKYWRIAPNVVVEILSASDDWQELMEKVAMWRRNGVDYVIAIDPFEGRRHDEGSPPAGFTIDAEAISRA